MKKTIAIIVTLGLAAASQAVLIEDFESYALGNLNENNSSGAVSGWYGTSQNTGTGNIDVIVDPINGAGNQVAMAYASSSGGRGVYKAVNVWNGAQATLSFDLMLNTIGDSRVIHFGFATDRSGDDVVSPFGDFEAFVGLKGTGSNIVFEARNGGVTDTLVTDLTASIWHSVVMEVDTVTDTYDVYFDASLVGTGLKFRVNTGEPVVEVKDLETLTLYANKATTQDITQFGAVDNINLTVVPEPGTLGLMAAGAGLLFWRRRSAR